MKRILATLPSVIAAVVAALASWRIAEVIVPCSGEQLSCSIQGFVFAFGVAGYALLATLIMVLVSLRAGGGALNKAATALLVMIVVLAVFADQAGMVSPADPYEARFVISLLYGPMAVGVLIGWLTVRRFTPSP